MCLLALLYRVTEDAPLIVAANREEYYQRGGLPPALLPDVAAVAGTDPARGGTWLGVNASGVLVAVTNRRKSDVPASPPSRGLLVRELLGCATAREAVERAVARLEAAPFDGCNLLIADSERAVVVHAGDWLRVRPLPPGLHVLANSDVNDESDDRVQHAIAWLSAHPLRYSAHAVPVLRHLCASREPAAAPMCVREAERGTVSSSVLVLRRRLEESTYMHAQGPPDRVEYADVSGLLRRLAGHHRPGT